MQPLTRSRTIDSDFECISSPIHNDNDNVSISRLAFHREESNKSPFKKRTAVHFAMQSSTNCDVDHAQISNIVHTHADYRSAVQSSAKKERSCDHMKLDHCTAIQNISYVLDLYHSWMRSQKAIIKNNNDGIYDRIHNKNSQIRNRTQLLNDFHHILDEHTTSNRDLETVQKYIQNTASCGSCKLRKGQTSSSTCNIIIRHLRDTSKEHNNRGITTRYFFGYKDTKEIVTQQILDTIHSFIYHSFDTLRFTTKEQLQIDALCSKRNSGNDAHDFINAEAIKKAQNIIAKKKKMVGLICKYDPYKSKKKFLSVVSNNNHANDDVDEEEKHHVVHCKTQSSLSYLSINPMDIDNDAAMNHNGSTLMSVYSFGKQFIYHKDEFTQTFHLLIKPVYKNFKDELLNNQIYRVSVSNYNDTYEKALLAFDTNKAKRLKRRHDADGSQRRQKTDFISIQHLLSIIFYTDYSVLCEQFSGTYRKSTANEKWRNVVQRHSQYYHWGFFLKESVECFGDLAKGNTAKSRKKNTFYHGLNQQLAFTTFVAQFYGPTSFTDQLTVAQTFAKEHGMILSLQPHSKYPSLYFDCKWLSLHPAESEKLFIGGQNPLNIHTIITISNPQTNHRKCLVAMMHISQMIGVESKDIKLKFRTDHERYVQILVDNELGTDRNTDIAHKYMLDSFHIFCQSVEHVIIDAKHILFDKMPDMFKSEDGVPKIELLKQLFPNAQSFNVNAANLAKAHLLLQASENVFGNNAVEQLEDGMLVCLSPNISTGYDTNTEETDQITQELMTLVAIFVEEEEFIVMDEEEKEEEIRKMNQWYHNDKLTNFEMDDIIIVSAQENRLEELREQYIDNYTGLGRPNGVCKDGVHCGWHDIEQEVFTTLSLAQKLHGYFYHNIECEEYEAHARSQKYCETHFKNGIRKSLLISPLNQIQEQTAQVTDQLPLDLPLYPGLSSIASLSLLSSRTRTASCATTSGEGPPLLDKHSSIAYTNDIYNKPDVEYVSTMDEIAPAEYATLQFGHCWEIDMIDATFGDPKQEILENVFSSLEKDQWNDVLKQSIRISKKREAKSMRLSVKLVVALKLYTDCDKLQDQFILAYRHEFKQQRIKRQRAFCYWNQLLEESCSRSQDIITDKLYRGVNSQVKTTSFTGTFWGPVSCTTEFGLANGFVGAEGTILEMYPTYSRRGLMVHWLSMFPYEKEVIYFNTSFQISHIYYKASNIPQMSRPQSCSPSWATLNKGFCFGLSGNNMHAYEMSQSDFMERAILKSLQLLNTESNVISFCEYDNDSAGFNRLDCLETIAVLYLLYLQYRSEKWNEFWNQHDENIKFAFAKYRDQFIALAMNVRAVKMEKLSMWLQDFFCCDQEKYEFPIQGSTKADIDKAAAYAEDHFIACRPLNFGTIVRLFPNAQQLSINGDNFDWSLESFVHFADQYQLDYQSVALQDIHIKFDKQFPNNNEKEVDPNIEPGSNCSPSLTSTRNYSPSLTCSTVSTLADVQASKRLNKHKHISRNNLHQLTKMGWKFMSPSHITRIGFEPLPEMPFVMTFIKNDKMYYRTYSQVLLNKEAFLTMNTSIDSLQIQRSDESELSSYTRKSQLITPQAVPPLYLNMTASSYYDDEGGFTTASFSPTSPSFSDSKLDDLEFVTQPGLRNRASSYYKLNSSMTKKASNVRMRLMDDEKEEKEGAVRTRGMLVDYNPMNCTLSAQMFASLSYKQELIEQLLWKISHPNVKNIKNKLKLSFHKYCNMVKALVLDPIPNELKCIFLKDVSKTIPSFEAIFTVFPNVCDVFLRDTQLKPKICFALITFLKQNKNCKMERIFFTKEMNQRLAPKHEHMVRFRLAELEWDLNVVEQMIYCETALAPTDFVTVH